MSGFALGQRVKYAEHIRRRNSRPGEFLGPDRIWSSHAGPGMEKHKWPGGEGIIVGRRTLSNGVNHYNGYDEPIVYEPTERFTAWLVAFDLHRKPVHVLPEHITPIPMSNWKVLEES